MNKFLLRDDAPLTPEAWEALDAVMVGAAKGVLAGRRLLTVEGPYGLGLKAVPLQDSRMQGGVAVATMIPLALVQTQFVLGRRDLAAYERDHMALDFGVVVAAAIECARLEDTLVFQGLCGMPGLVTCEGANSVTLSGWEKVGTAADDLIKAVTQLDSAGFHGPYALALAPDRYNLLLRRYPQASGTELEHLGVIAAAGVFKAPVLEKGGVLVASGAPYAGIAIGQDMAIGYIGPVEEALEFSVSESLALLVRQTGAVCVLQAA